MQSWRSLCIALVLMMPVLAYATPGGIPHPYNFSLKPVDSIRAPGPATFELSLRANPAFTRPPGYPCQDDVTLRLILHGNLKNPGPEQFQVALQDSQWTAVRFTVNIPDNDTTGFTIDGGCWIEASRYFVTTGYYMGPDVRVPIEIYGGPPSYASPLHDYVEKWELGPHGWRPTGVHIYLVDSLRREIDPDTLAPAAPVDTAGQPYMKVEEFHHDEDSLRRARLEQELVHQAELEQAPLVGSKYQEIVVDGQLLVRKEGETKFSPAGPGQTLQEGVAEYRRYIDSLTAAQAHIKLDALLDLRPSGHLAVARRLVDSLVPTDTAGMYRAQINRGTWVKLVQEGVSVRAPDDSLGAEKRRQMRTEPGGIRKHRPDISSVSSAPADQLFSGGFESWFPNPKWRINAERCWSELTRIN